MNLKAAFDRIMYLTGREEGDLLSIAWETGYALIEHVEEGNETMAAKIKRSRIFWNWYNKQFGRLTKEFLDQKADVRWDRVAKETIWSEYQVYIKEYKLPEHGNDSYIYLVQEVLAPQFRNENKSKEIFSHSKI